MSLIVRKILNLYKDLYSLETDAHVCDICYVGILDSRDFSIMHMVGRVTFIRKSTIRFDVITQSISVPKSMMKTMEIYGRVRHLYLKLVFDRRWSWIHFQQKLKIEMKPSSHQTAHIFFIFKIHEKRWFLVIFTPFYE